MIDRKKKCITIAMMIVLGTCMHFVLDLLPPGPFATILGNIFPVNETSWEHMKMIWYPFLIAGITYSVREKDRGYFAAFVLSGAMAMQLQLGLFSIYQSFTGTSVLFFDIIIYFATMFFCILLAYDFAQKVWAHRVLPFWILLAAMITSGIVYLTYYPGSGYVFLDDYGFVE